MSRILLASLAVLSSAAAVGQPAAPATPTPPLGGPEVKGVCLLSQQTVYGTSKIGQAATARLRELVQQAQAEVDADHKPIITDAQALQSEQSTLKPADLAQKQQVLQERLQNVERKSRQRNQEIEATREKALARIFAEAQSVIAAVYKAHGCGLLLDRSVVLGGNMNGDLTADVVKGLDAKITTITFDRETLPPPAAGGAP
jgi:Skp family chaperone for outer membrane proteins